MTSLARIGRRVALPLIAALAASGCGDAKHVSANAPSDATTKASRDALVYAAVVRQLVTRDHGFGGASSPYRHVYVLDGVVRDASNPMRLVDRPAAPFAARLARQIIGELSALPPVSLMDSRHVVVGGPGTGHVIHRGVLITLGPIRWIDGHTARVSNNRWASGLNGQWLTYTVRYENASWRVAGIAGSRVAIS